MQANQLFVPDKLRVGFVNRDDTYTGQLAYVIYYDKKGKIRKEVSWQNWRNQSIKPLELDNEPMEGFVLNKGVGGTRASYGWNPRNEYIRVYDPRGFEFEISVPNLLFILQQCDCSRGKGIEGKLVYSWDGKELVLLPVESQEYKNSKEYTKLQGKKVSAKDLIKGATYLTKKEEEWIYLGRFAKHTLSDDTSLDYYYYRDEQYKPSYKKYHIFIHDEEYVFLSSMDRLSVCVNEHPVQNYPELLDNYLDSTYGSPIVKYELRPKKLVVNDRYYRRFDYQLSDKRILRYGPENLNVEGRPPYQYDAYYLSFHQEITINSDNSIDTKKYNAYACPPQFLHLFEEQVLKRAIGYHYLSVCNQDLSVALARYGSYVEEQVGKDISDKIDWDNFEFQKLHTVTERGKKFEL